MLSRFDGIALVVAERAAAASRWQTLLDALVLEEDKSAAWVARRTRLAVGCSVVELLEPDGEGPAAEFLRRRRGLGPFAVRVQAPDPERLCAALERRGASVARDGSEHCVSGAALGLPGLNLTLVPETLRRQVGLISRLYEATWLVSDAAAATARLAHCLGLDTGRFCPISSEQFGYSGSLTLFRDGELDRIEVVHPHDPTRSMGRFFGRHGASLYMAYAESARTAELRERAREHAPQGWTGPHDAAVPDNLFLHHTALGGAMLGVSRTTYAWTWSGAPERVEPA